MNSRHWSSGDGSTIDYRLHTASQSHFTNILIHHSASMSTLSTLGTQWSYDQKILTLGDRCNDPDRRMQKLQSCTISTLSMYALPSSRLIIRWINPESSIKLRDSPPIPLSLSKLTEIFTGNSIWQLILMVIFLLEFLSKTLRRIHLYIQSVNKLKITSIFSFRSKGVKFLNFISNWCDEPRQIPCRCHIHCPYKKHIPGPGYLILFFL